jgi:hypothetical protein
MSRRHPHPSKRTRGALFVTCALTVVLGPRGVDAQNGECGFAGLLQADKVLALCCESTSAKDCSKGFPKTCNLACAKIMVPWYNGCSKSLKTMPPGNWKFKIADLAAFTQNCEHVQELFQHSASHKCADNAKEKEQRILDVTAACCSQGGKFACKTGMPWTCNAECELG